VRLHRSGGHHDSFVIGRRSASPLACTPPSDPPTKGKVTLSFSGPIVRGAATRSPAARPPPHPRNYLKSCLLHLHCTTSVTLKDKSEPSLCFAADFVRLIMFGNIVIPNYYPATDGATAEAVAKAVSVAYEPWMQDWPIEVADGARTGEFLSHYEKEERPERRVAIAELIVASLDDVAALGVPSKDLLDKAGSILKMYPHIVEYWSCADAHDEDEMFHITPWIRTL